MLSLNRPREFQQMAFAVLIFSEGFGPVHTEDRGSLAPADFTSMVSTLAEFH